MVISFHVDTTREAKIADPQGRRKSTALHQETAFVTAVANFSGLDKCLRVQLDGDTALDNGRGDVQVTYVPGRVTIKCREISNHAGFDSPDDVTYPHSLGSARCGRVDSAPRRPAEPFDECPCVGRRKVMVGVNHAHVQP